MDKRLRKRLIWARERAGLNRKTVAEMTGINYKTLSGYENGVSAPNVETLQTMANCYGMTLDELMGIYAKHTVFDMAELLKNESIIVEYNGQPVPSDIREVALRVISGLMHARQITGE